MEWNPEVKVSITTLAISPEEVVRSVSHPGAGATVLFLGTVRDFGKAGRVREVTYEAYIPLARKGLAEIGQEIQRKWPGSSIKIVHRMGRLGVEEVSVAIAVSSAHRKGAFAACRFAIEKIKRSTPIWKKEKLVTGAEVWTEGRKMV